MAADFSERYFELLKRCLTGSLHGEAFRSISPAREGWRGQLAGLAARGMQGLLRPFGLEVVRRVAYDAQRRSEGRDWPAHAETMIGLKRLNQLQNCIEEVIKENIPGDLIECGVWRGGAGIFMRAMLELDPSRQRKVWLADSFQGLPPPNARQYPADKGDVHHRYTQLAVSLDEVQANFERYGWLDDRVAFLPGWFRDTLPNAPMERLAVLRADGDMYESTMDILRHLYPKLSINGFCIIDDYGAIPACRQATDDYRREHGIQDPIHAIDWTGVYWRRST